jgi:hypothetical protein
MLPTKRPGTLLRLECHDTHGVSDVTVRVVVRHAKLPTLPILGKTHCQAAK